MIPVDVSYCDEVAATAERWRRLARLAMVCAVALALVGLARAEVSDIRVAGASPSRFVQHCHQSPDDLAWCEFVIWWATPGAAEYHAWATAPKVSSSATTVWDELRRCEAPDWAGGWSANTGNGFYGGLQFTLRSWRWVGGSGYPHQHPRETQIAMGERLLDLQGWGAWPACSRKLGLR